MKLVCWLWLASLICVALGITCMEKDSARVKEDTGFLLVKPTNWNSGCQANMVSDPAKVQRILSCLQNAPRENLLCGFHWFFLYVKNGVVWRRYRINEECEDEGVLKCIRKYFPLRRGTHNLYSVQLKAGYDHSAFVAAHSQNPFYYVFADSSTDEIIVVVKDSLAVLELQVDSAVVGISPHN